MHADNSYSNYSSYSVPIATSAGPGPSPNSPYGVVPPRSVAPIIPIVPRHLFGALHQDEQITGRIDKYTIKRIITRANAEAILKQTGIELQFAPGEEEIANRALGRGGFGEVFIGFAAQRAHFVAIKIIRDANASEKEARLQLALSGLPCIIPTIDTCKTDQTLYLVTELAGLGSAAKLKEQIDKITDHAFKEQVIYCLAKGLLVGLSQMHQRGFYHLDMKPHNLVVRQDGQIFIIDFGCSCRSENGLIKTSDEIGDRNYFSPERWLSHYRRIPEQCAADKIDAWAAGLTILDLLTNREGLPFKGVQALVDSHATGQAIQEYIQKALDLAPPPAPDSIWSLVHGLLMLDPARRLSPTEALQHPWLERMDKDAPNWQAATLNYLREMVQATQRETRVAKATVFSPLSPQDLPLPHFASFIERPQLQEMLLKSMLGGTYERVSVLAYSGMGGVGKTQLLTYLLHHPKVHHHFGLKLWFRSSDSKSLLETQCHFLAQELRLVDKTAPIEVALQKLHAYLEAYHKQYGKPWLAIFDNAEDPALLAPFLPRSGGQVVVTTRSALWREAISIDVLTPEEGIALINKLLQRADSLSGALAQALGYLPLGLVQACAYIRNQQMPLATYLEQLQKAPALLVSDERLYGKKLPHSLMSLWQMTFTTLASSCPEALALLDQLAYLAPEAIPQPLLSKLSAYAAQAALEQYALLQTTASGSTVHRLLQLVVRAQHQSDQQQTALEKVMRGLHATYVGNPPTQQERQTNVQLLAHGEHVLAHHDALLDEVQISLCAHLADTCLWLGNLQGELAKPYIKKDLLLRALTTAEKAYGKDHADVAICLNNLGAAWNVLGDARQAIGYYERALAIDEKTFGKEHPNVAIPLNNLGNAWSDLGDAHQAIGYYERALAIGEKTYGKEHPSVAIRLNNLGVAWKDLGDARQAIGYYERALAINEKTYGKEHPNVATDLNNLGAAWADLGDARQAIGYYERALAIDEKTYGKEHPKVAMRLNGLGNAWADLSDARQAIGYYERALAIDEKTYGKEHPNVAIRLNNLGTAWADLGDARQAIGYFERALAIDEKTFGKEHPKVAIALNNLGVAWKALGDARQAIGYYERALAIDEKTYGKEHPSVATSLNNLGSAWQALGDARQAIGYFERALAIDEKTYGKEHPKVAMRLNNLGLAWADLRDARQAIGSYERALAIDEKTYGKEHPKVARDLFNLGLAWQALGDKYKAIALFEQAYGLALSLPGLGPNHPHTKKFKTSLDQAKAGESGLDGGKISVGSSTKQKRAKDKCRIM